MNYLWKPCKNHETFIREFTRKIQVNQSHIEHFHVTIIIWPYSHRPPIKGYPKTQLSTESTAHITLLHTPKLYSRLATVSYSNTYTLNINSLIDLKRPTMTQNNICAKVSFLCLCNYMCISPDSFFDLVQAYILKSNKISYVDHIMTQIHHVQKPLQIFLSSRYPLFCTTTSTLTSK